MSIKSFVITNADYWAALALGFDLDLAQENRVHRTWTVQVTDSTMTEIRRAIRAERVRTAR